MDPSKLADRTIDVLERKTVYRGFISVDEVTVRYERPDGELSDPVERTSVEKRDAVGILVWIRRTQQLLLVRQFRYPTMRHGEPWLSEIVAGAIDPGESAKDAAIRELREETGIECSDLQFLTEFFGSPGNLSERVTIFGVTVEEPPTATEGGLPGEDLEIMLHSAAEIYEALADGKVHDGKTQVALYRFFASDEGRGFTGAAVPRFACE